MVVIAQPGPGAGARAAASLLLVLGQTGAGLDASSMPQAGVGTEPAGPGARVKGSRKGGGAETVLGLGM